MTDLPDSSQSVQQEATQFRAPVSESAVQSIGALANYCKNQIAILFARGIGEVKFSMDDEAAFQSEFGTGWVLADGRNVAGSAYATKYSTTVIPDFRGVSPRFGNNGRSDSYANPDGDQATGTLNQDKYKSHNHGVTDPGHHHEILRGSGSSGDAGNAPTNTQVDGVYQDSTGTTTPYQSIATGTTGVTVNSNGNNETASKTGILNGFIKIN